MASRQNFDYVAKTVPSSTFRYSPSNSNNNNSPIYTVTGITNSSLRPVSSSSTGSQFSTTQIDLINNSNNNVDTFSFNSSSVMTDNAESECLEHYELNLEKYKGKHQL